MERAVRNRIVGNRFALPAMLLSTLGIGCAHPGEGSPPAAPARPAGEPIAELFGPSAMVQIDAGEMGIGTWPREDERPLRVHVPVGTALRVDLKAPAWVEVWVDHHQRFGARLRAGSHRLPVLPSGLRVLELRSRQPLRAFLSHPARDPKAFGLEGPLRVPPGATLSLRSDGDVRATLTCATPNAEPAEATVAPNGTIALRPCDDPETPARLALSWARDTHVSSAALHGYREPAPPRPRHVVMVLMDTLRVDRLTAFNPRARPETPEMTRIAEESAVYERTIAASNWTKPSVATLLTGLPPERHGATTHDAALPADLPFIPEEARDAGVRTGAFVSNGYITGRYGFGRGWTHFETGNGDRRGARADALVERALTWIDAERAQFPDRPLFTYIHTTDPHYPYDPPGDILDDYHQGPRRVNVGNRQLLQHVDRGVVQLDDEGREELVARYDAEVAHHDRAMGALYEGLRERGMLQDTLLVFVADHGEELFDHGRLGHGDHRLWDELVHVPMIVRWPDGEGRRVQRPVGHVDLAETLRWALGVPAGDGGGEPLFRTPVGPLEPRRSIRPGAMVAIDDGLAHAIVPFRPGRRVILRPARDGDFARLLRYVDHISTADASAPAAVLGANDAETLAQLRALGYIE